jgi:hypothetical protein
MERVQRPVATERLADQLRQLGETAQQIARSLAEATEQQKKREEARPSDHRRRGETQQRYYRRIYIHIAATLQRLCDTYGAGRVMSILSHDMPTHHAVRNRQPHHRRALREARREYPDAAQRGTIARNLIRPRPERLTPAAVAKYKARTTRIEVPDGHHGLYLLIHPSGTKRWVVRFRKTSSGQNTKVTLGPWPAMSLKEARRLAASVHEQRFHREWVYSGPTAGQPATVN